MSETKTAPIPTHVRGSVDEDGRKRPAHIAVRHKKVTFRENVGSEDDTSAIAGDPVSAFIVKHGGVEHLRQSLEAMTGDQRAKLIDAMAHLGAVTPADVMKKLGIHEPEASQDKAKVDELAAKVRARFDAALEENIISADDHGQLIGILVTAGPAAAIAAVAGLRPPEPPVIVEAPVEAPVHIVETDPAALEATRRMAADNAVKQEKADSLYEKHVDSTNKAVRQSFEIAKRQARKWKVPAQMRESEAQHRKNAAQFLQDWRDFCQGNDIVIHEGEEM